jgi:hypothetical protein
VDGTINGQMRYKSERYPTIRDALLKFAHR